MSDDPEGIGVGSGGGGSGGIANATKAGPTCASLGNPSFYVPNNPCQCNVLCRNHGNCCRV